jgi:membrane protein YqaA with SNARE-associated domain
MHQPDRAMQHFLELLSLPEFGLTTLFTVAFISATLLPLGSEPALFGLLKLNPDLFWTAIAVATAGNTLGSALTWLMGWGSSKIFLNNKFAERRALLWLQRRGPKACLWSWLPVVGDPLCAVAGWLKLPFWPCVAYMAIGKCLRYVAMSVALLWVFPGAIQL